jgi:murein DD-endopeptidase MepM/ murein hydrolase activator NlpD
MIRARASGGALSPAVKPLLAAAASSPENTFGLLRELLSALESRLQLVRTDVERREAVAAATPSIWPAHGWLSANFGSRKDPITGNPDYHPALDISADKGDPVYATADGRVASAAFSGAYGNLVEIDHGFGMVTRYAHLSKFLVAPGADIKRGDLVGYVGATGRTTGSHLHYEVWLHGKPVNPMRLLADDEHQ